MKKYLMALTVCSSMMMPSMTCQQVFASERNLSIDSEDIEISSDEVSENGTLCAYIPHRFTLEETDIPVSDPAWTLSLPLDNGGFKFIQLSDDELSCTIDPFDDASGYRISEDGIMEAQLQFTCMLNGETVATKPYEILLDFKPYIEYAVIEKIEDEAPYTSYNAYYKVKYYGADKIKVSVEEEFGSKVMVTYLYEPYIAYGCATHITAPYLAWIDFAAENNYGKDLYTIELLPYGEVVNSVENITDDISSARPEWQSIEVYDTHGMKIAEINDISEVSQLPVKGLLLIREVSASGESRTKKIMNR